MALFEYTERPLTVAIITVSDTRDIHSDKGGLRAQELCLEAGLIPVIRKVVKDDANELAQVVNLALDHLSEIEEFEERQENGVHRLEVIEPTLLSTLQGVDIVITTGGTGIAKKDVSIEAVKPLFDKEVPGFGELFRFLSYRDDIGTKAMASRAIAGTRGTSLIFTIPGSVGAVTLAMKELILPEVKHLKRELIK